GDGHLVGKKQNQVILTFCLLNEGENVLKPDHQHSICIYIGKENKNSLQLAWSYFTDEIKDIKSNGYIDPDNFHWDVEFFISADWKFLQLVHGIKAPTSEYFCLYCDCSKFQRANMNIQWSNTYNTKKQ
ncbi:11965_t:CDS:2, partial [Entrophospora sp. SA101]